MNDSDVCTVVVLPGDGIGPEVTAEAVAALILLSEGFGLGLSACYEIVKRHDGDVRVRNGRDGAVFSIELPLLMEEPDGESRAAGAAR